MFLELIHYDSCFSPVLSEIVYVRDVADDVNKRELETELPSSMVLSLKRGSNNSDITLQLEENTLLNHNAPMFTHDGNDIVQLEDIPIEVFYKKRYHSAYHLICNTRTFFFNVYVSEDLNSYNSL